jgi:FtsZ-interacting cell division protein ZipA
MPIAPDLTPTATTHSVTASAITFSLSPTLNPTSPPPSDSRVLSSIYGSLLGFIALVALIAGITFLRRRRRAHATKTTPLSSEITQSQDDKTKVYHRCGETVLAFKALQQSQPVSNMRNAQYERWDRLTRGRTARSSAEPTNTAVHTTQNHQQSPSSREMKLQEQLLTVQAQLSAALTQIGGDSPPAYHHTHSSSRPNQSDLERGGPSS